jgi:Uma2 family endonuclease
MATAPTIPLVPVDEYLNSSYHPDMEYVDGVLVERAMPTPAHAALQAIIAEHLRKHRENFGYGALTECRVELVKRSRYRIPDILLCSAPVPRTKALETIPLAVIEIWSPDDRIGQQMARFREYWARGVRQILVLDPEEFVTLRYHAGSLTEEAVNDIQLPDGRKVPFPATELLEALRQELE